MRRVLLLVIVLLLVSTLNAAAQVADSTAVSGLQTLGNDSMVGLVLRLVLTLAVVIGLILLSVWGLKRLMTRRWPGKSKERPVRIIDRVQLAPKRSLDVVAVGERIILLGVTENGINFLTELSPEEKSRFGTATAGQPGFRSTLDEAKSRMQQVFSQARTSVAVNAMTAGSPSKAS